MKYIKTFRFWIAFFALIYTLVGFVFIPWFLTNKTASLLKEKIGLHVEIGKANFNPYTFDLSVHNILVKDLNNKPVIGFKKIFIDYMPIGLFNKTILFKTLEIDSPKLYVKLKKDGSLNLENILAVNKSKSKSKSTSSMPDIILQKIDITNGNINFSDLRSKTPFNLELGPYAFKAHDVSTKKGDLNAHSFRTKIGKDSEMFWEGGMKLNPLSFYGEINISKLKLPKLYSYALPNSDAVLQNGLLSLVLPYQIDLSKELKANINKAKLTLTKISIINKNTKNIIVDIPKFQVNGFDLKWPKQDVTIQSVKLENSSIFTLMDKNHEFSLIKSFQTQNQTSTNDNNDTKPWTFVLKNVKVNKTKFTLIDISLAKPVKNELKDISLHVKNISSTKTSPIKYEFASIINTDTQLKFSGNILQKPLRVTSNMQLSNLHVKEFTPYIKPFVNIDINNANLYLKAKIDADFSKKIDIEVNGDAFIKKLHINTLDNKKLLTWEQLALNAIHYEYNPMSIEIKSIKVNKPYIKMIVAKNGTTNFSNLIKESPKQEQKNQKPIKIKIGPMILVNGTSDFSDFSLPFKFKTHIHDLVGNLSILDFQTTTPSLLNLTGKIDKYGYAKIDGRLTPSNIKNDTTLNVLFKNIDLNTMTPYSGKFVGYKIKSGKLSMDLKYSVKKSELLGDNKINIDTLFLGETVKSPDAVSLPLELAIALLKDSNGQIDIDMPVSGNMDNPDFSYGGVIWGAVGNMITGIVTAPFRFLGAILGIDGDALKSIDFDKGSSAIISTEHEKLSNLHKILSKRPSIKLTIQGGYDEVYDVQALQKKKLISLISEELKKVKTDKKATKTDTYGIVLKKLYTTKFTLKQYEKEKKSMLINKKGEKIKLDEVAFNTLLEDALLKDIKISYEELILLANQRAKNIKASLVKEYKIDKTRVTIKPPSLTNAKRDRWIQSKLEIAI